MYHILPVFSIYVNVSPRGNEMILAEPGKLPVKVINIPNAVYLYTVSLHAHEVQM